MDNILLEMKISKTEFTSFYDNDKDSEKEGVH